MIKKEGLELVAVNNDGKKVEFTFLDMEAERVHTVSWNKQSFKDGKFVDDPEKSERVEGWSQDIFGCAFVDLSSKIGEKKDVYVYDRFCSLWKSNVIAKFDSSMKGQIYQTEIKEVLVDDLFIKIRYEIEGSVYESKMTMCTWIESMKKYFVDDAKTEKVYEAFEDKYGVPVERAQEIVGTPIMVEVKAAFGTSLYGDIKKPKRK